MYFPVRLMEAFCCGLCQWLNEFLNQNITLPSPVPAPHCTPLPPAYGSARGNPQVALPLMGLPCHQKKTPSVN